MKDGLFFLALVIFSACSQTNSSGGALKDLAWLAGNWKGTGPQGTAIEQWSIKNDSVMTGFGCFILGSDTVSQENLSIQIRGADLFYIPVVKDQNDGAPVEFKLTSRNEKEWIFENRSHDFPQIITYQKITNDSLVAKIAGLIEGKMQSDSFPMHRQPLVK